MTHKVDRKTIFTLSFVISLFVLVVLHTNGDRLALPSWISERISPRAAESPEDSIYAMLDAARAGDTQAYLDSFSTPMREQLVQIIKENSAPKFAEYLKAQNTSFQSVAITVADRPSDAEVQARVEYVYANRNEVQNLYLKKESSRWRICSVAGANQIKTLVPFGTTVRD